MKRASVSVTILLLISLSGSLSCGSKMETPSHFLRSFSLARIVNQMNLQDIGLMSADVSGTAALGPPTSQRRENDILLTIAGSKIEQFDEEQFLIKLSNQIVNELGQASLKVTSGGGGSGGVGHTLNLEYEGAEFKGGIDIIGIRAAKDRYRLWCVVREFDYGPRRP